MDITNSSIACNQGGNDPTSKVLDVNAGSDMVFKWTNVRPSAPFLYLPFDSLSCHWLATVALRPFGPCYDSHGFLQRRLHQVHGYRW